MRNHASLRAPAAALLASAAALTAASCSLVLGIGEPSLDPAGGAGGSGGSATVTTASVTTAVGSTTSSGAGGSGGGQVTYPCSPTNPVCNQVKSDCLAVFDNTGKTSFGVRVGQLDFFQPVAFSGTLEKAAFFTSITMNLPKCNLKGSGTFSWLVQVDTAANTFQIGAAKPPADPHDGYSFVNETIDIGGKKFPIAPVSGAMTLDADGTIHADTLDFIQLPVYLDSQATSLILVPIHKVRVFETKISADRNCIGKYNAAGLMPGDGCLPSIDKNIPAFLNGGKIDGFISLEEADSIIITSFGLNRSLCVLLSNSAGAYGDGGSPQRCKRDGAGQIKFNGDWCSSMNAPATATCYDAEAFYAGFAASAVEIK